MTDNLIIVKISYHDEDGRALLYTRSYVLKGYPCRLNENGGANIFNAVSLGSLLKKRYMKTDNCSHFRSHTSVLTLVLDCIEK